MDKQNFNQEVGEPDIEEIIRFTLEIQRVFYRPHKWFLFSLLMEKFNEIEPCLEAVDGEWGGKPTKFIRPDSNWRGEVDDNSLVPPFSIRDSSDEERSINSFYFHHSIETAEVDAEWLAKLHRDNMQIVNAWGNTVASVEYEDFEELPLGEQKFRIGEMKADAEED